MQCSRCQSEAPASAEFCPACGGRLRVGCAACGAPNAPDHNFCQQCGHALTATGDRRATPRFDSPRAYTPKHLVDKILTSRPSLEGERKQVTVLFADVSGFTGLSERLDPEDIHGLMAQAFEVMLGEVHRYEGTVNQFLGDGIMALFGAPIGHEDHAERAVHAALGIRRALEALRDAGRPGTTLAVRQGINTGLVVVGSIGNDLRMDYTAIGDTTNVAARLQQTAEPGSVVISEATHRAVAAHFHARSLGPLRLKGKADPVGAWAVISSRTPRTRLEIRAEQGLTRFVGREAELRTLVERFETARAGHGQVVFLVGEPGIGKSRLLYELRRRLADDFTWLEGHCVSFGRYAHPFGEQSYYTRLAVGALSADDGGRMAAAVLRTAVLPREVQSLIMDKAEGNPFFLEEVVKSLRELRVMRERDGRYELVKPAEEISVPDTIQDVITARIDRLGDRAKKTLQTAAVIGRDFGLALLEQTMEMADGLAPEAEPLRQLEFVHEKRSAPEPVYTFGHSLTQEVAYEGLLVRRRQELHGTIARLIEGGAGERLPEQYPVLAHHYSRAQDGAKAVEYLMKAGDRAVGLYANTEAVGYYVEALAQLDKRPLAPEQDEQRIDIVMRLCGVSGSLVDFERDLRNLADALALTRKLGDQRRESQVLYWTGRLHYLTGRPTSSIDHVEHALALADVVGDDTLAAMPLNLLGRLYFLRSDFEKNVRMLERSAVLFERDGNRFELATAWAGLGWSLGMIGQFDRALAEADRGVALAQEIGHLPTEAACRMYRACARFPRGDWRPAIEDVRRALSIAEQLGDAFRVYLTRGFLGGFLVMAGDREEGIALLGQAVEAAERLRTTQGLGTFRLFRAAAALAAGDAAEGGRDAREAFALASAQGDRWCQAWARRVLAEALMQGAPPDLDAAEQEIIEAIRSQREIGTRPDLARSLSTHARILERRGEQARAREAAAESARLLSEMGMAPDRPPGGRA